MPDDFAVLVTPGPADGYPLAVIGPFADRGAAQAAAEEWNEVRAPDGDGNAQVWRMWPPK